MIRASMAFASPRNFTMDITKSLMDMDPDLFSSRRSKIRRMCVGSNFMDARNALKF